MVLLTLLTVISYVFQVTYNHVDSDIYISYQGNDRLCTMLEVARQTQADDSGGTSSSHDTPPPPAPPIITIEGAADEGRVVSGGQPDGERSRRRSTVLGVTQEARIVLEQFLKRSLSQNDASPYQHEQHQAIMEVIEEHPDMRILRSDSYQQAALANKLVERGGQTGDSEEPAYVYPHQLVYTTNSISSEGSYGVSLKSGATSRSPSDKVTLAVHPPKVKAKGKKTTRFDASSSSSTEDYEYVDNELLTRKKKSFFRWASERLRQSFRRKKERAGELESPKDEAALPMPFEEKPSKKKKGRLAAALSLKRNASERSKSSSTPNEAVSDSRTYVKEAHAKPSGGEVVTLHADDTEQMAERKKSPVPWKHNKRKDGHLVDEGGSRDRGVFENFLRQIRKGSMRLRRKGSKGMSAIIIMYEGVPVSNMMPYNVVVYLQF